jgi:hypothetical protein
MGTIYVGQVIAMKDGEILAQAVGRTFESFIGKLANAYETDCGLDPILQAKYKAEILDCRESKKLPMGKICQPLCVMNRDDEVSIAVLYSLLDLEKEQPK